jgi:hypothetical protein
VCGLRVYFAVPSLITARHVGTPGTRSFQLCQKSEPLIASAGGVEPATSRPHLPSRSKPAFQISTSCCAGESLEWESESAPVCVSETVRKCFLSDISKTLLLLAVSKVPRCPSLPEARVYHIVWKRGGLGVAGFVRSSMLLLCPTEVDCLPNTCELSFGIGTRNRAGMICIIGHPCYPFGHEQRKHHCRDSGRSNETQPRPHLVR